MANERRYNLHFLVARDGDEYSALCYEFTTAGCGPDAEAALRDAISATVEYLEHLIQAGRASEAPRPAPAELVLEYADLPVDDEVTTDQLKQALGKVVVAAVVLERKVQVEYDLESGRLSYELPPLSLPTMTEPLTSYPVELVFAGG
jgi:hypothetical protein